MDTFNLDTIKQLIGEDVTIVDQESGIELISKISNVEASSLHGNEWEAFSTTLVVEPDSPCIAQGVCKITNAKLGEGEMFVTANSPTEYEIVVSRKLS